MKYLDLYPPPPRQIFNPGPHPEVEPGVFQTPSAYACFGCMERTSFTIDLGPGVGPVHCCSRSCRDYIEACEEDSRREDPEFYAALVRPSSSLVEQSPDTGEVEGSIPSLGTES